MEDKVALITGAGRGIGEAVARQLHQDGLRVALCGRNLVRLQHLQAELGPRSLTVPADVRHRDSVREAVERVADAWGSIDVVVNNAGISGVTPVDSGDIDAWLDVVQTNLAGAYFVTHFASPHLRDGGRVINVSSVLGKFGVPGYTAYCASKAGIIGFTRALALELAPRRITVNAICPGWTDTDMAHDGMRQISESLGISKDDFYRDAMSRVPLGEMVSPAEVAGLVSYLVSPAAAKVTAQAISICGGSTQA